MDEENNDFIENLAKNLSKLPLNKNAEIDLKLIYLPAKKLKPSKNETPFASALKESFNNTSVKNIGRKFLIPATSSQIRKKFIREISKEVKNIMEQVPKNAEMHLSLDINTDVDIANDLNGTPQPSSKTVVYNPRDVGNDMGLWIIGTAWLDLVKDIMPSVIEKTSNDKFVRSENWLINGLGYVILARPRKAIECFNNAVKMGQAEVGFLGLSAAFIELGREDEAKKYNLKVLRINPKNEIAKRNLKWLNASLENTKK